MEKLGYRHDESNPDLLVNFSADVSDRQDVTKTPASVRGIAEESFVLGGGKALARGRGTGAGVCSAAR